MYYGIFDSVIRCDRPLLELPPLPCAALDAEALEVRFDTLPVVSATSRNIRLRPWLEDSDRVVQGQFGEAILIRVSGLADFVVRPLGGLVVCRPCPQAHPSAVRHFLLNQILSRLVSVRDPLVIHSSAVVTARGAIALMGPAGSGKSTLATSFAVNGVAALMSDDGILVRLSGPSPRLVGAYACSRLRDDSVDALGLAEQSTPGDRPPWAKHALKIAPDRPASAVTAVARGFFLLTPAPPQQRDIVVAPLTGVAAVIALIANAFLLDPSDQSLIRNQFEAAAALIRTGCPFYSLTFPRRFTDLPRVRACILSALGD